MKFRQALFWDTDPQKISAKKNAQYVIERILDFGNDKEVKWLWDFYKKPFLKKIILNSKSIKPETKELWRLILKSH